MALRTGNFLANITLIIATTAPFLEPIHFIKKLFTLQIWVKKIVKIIRPLDPNKAYECENISIYLMTLCVTSVF